MGYRQVYMLGIIVWYHGVVWGLIMIVIVMVMVSEVGMVRVGNPKG